MRYVCGCRWAGRGSGACQTYDMPYRTIPSPSIPRSAPPASTTSSSGPALHLAPEPRPAPTPPDPEPPLTSSWPRSMPRSRTTTCPPPPLPPLLRNVPSPAAGPARCLAPEPRPASPPPPPTSPRTADHPRQLSSTGQYMRGGDMRCTAEFGSLSDTHDGSGGGDGRGEKPGISREGAAVSQCHDGRGQRQHLTLTLPLSPPPDAFHCRCAPSPPPPMFCPPALT